MKAYIDTISTSAENLRITAICKKLVELMSQFSNVSFVIEPTEEVEGFYSVLSVGGSQLAISVRYTGTAPNINETGYIGLVVNGWEAPTAYWTPNNFFYYQQYSQSVYTYNVFLLIADDDNNLIAFAQRRTGFLIFHSDSSVECQGQCSSNYDGSTFVNPFNGSGGVPVIGYYLDLLIKTGDSMEYVGTTGVPLINENINNHSLPSGKVLKFAKAVWNPMREISKEIEDEYPVNIIGAGIINNKTNNPTMTKIEVTSEDGTTQKYIHIGGTNWMPYDTLTQRNWNADE